MTRANYEKPFWLPAPGYYFMALSFCALAFYIVWWLFETSSETPWIPAGIVSSSLLFSFSVYREVFLRRAMLRYLATKNRLDREWNSTQRLGDSKSKKLALDKNFAILELIERKSRAARTLENVSEAHLEVFEMCDKYLNLTNKEIAKMGPDSLRIVSIMRGRQKVENLHRFHLFSWASIESRHFAKEAETSEDPRVRIDAATKALTVLDSALYFYPNESKLKDSTKVVKEILASAEVSFLVESGEAAEKRGDHSEAIRFYRDVVFYLAREDVEYKGNNELARRVSIKIENLRKISLS